jgi:hypothetical protein
MKADETGGNAASDFVTIGDVKAPVKIWSMVNTYKSREREKGRKLKMPEALCELAEIGANKENIKA